MAAIPVTSRKTTKISIPHPHERGNPGALVGVLEQLAPDEPTQGRRIALILHGSLGHKDYLFQKRLGLRLPLDSFRFDFRGNFESCGTWYFGNLKNDLEDIEVVAEYLATTFGYVVDLMVGHSRGAIVGMAWLCTSGSCHAKSVRGYVSASARYRMHKAREVTPLQQQQIDAQGFYERHVTVARQRKVVKVMPEDMDDFARFDTSYVWDRVPKTLDVLAVQGLQDQVVPAYDSLIYARALSPRAPGTFNLHMIEDGDHNFTGLQDDVVATILEWWESVERKELRTGIWHTGIRGKL